LRKIAWPNWFWNENPLATNWFSSEAACTISMLAPSAPLSTALMAARVALPMYRNEYCGKACSNSGPIRFGISRSR
jgi:hypothetical protein